MTTATVSNMKYFNAVSFNRRNESKLKEKEGKLEIQQRKAITKMWQDKFSLLDELVQINVRTPRFRACSDGQSESTSGENAISLGEVNIDAKLFATKPTSIGGRGKHIKVSPLIDVVGKEAICYPNSEAKKGRHVPLPYRTSRRIEAVRNHHMALNKVLLQKGKRYGTEKPNLFHVQKAKVVVTYRPITAVGKVNVHTNGSGLKKRPKTAII